MRSEVCGGILFLHPASPHLHIKANFLPHLHSIGPLHITVTGCFPHLQPKPLAQLGDGGGTISVMLPL